MISSKFSTANDKNRLIMERQGTYGKGNVKFCINISLNGLLNLYRLSDFFNLIMSLIYSLSRSYL